MNHRLQQFILAENITQSQFADSIGVARASVSHILAGRNKPGFDFIESMMKRYPSLNINWLISGQGRMYRDDLQGSKPEIISPVAAVDIELPFSESTESETIDNTTQQAENKRYISKVVVFYSDNTFEEIR